MRVEKTNSGKTLTMWTSEDIVGPCPLCFVSAVVPLPPHLVAAQPDETTHVCHLGFGGCNHGFAMEGA